MDNIKKFEDFLDRMQGLLNEAKKQGHIIVRVEDLENAFPELKESEDERIREKIIATIHLYYGEPLEDEAKEMIAWLEKQGDKDKLIKELGEYKVKYTQEVLEKHLNSMNNKDNERVRKTTIAFLKDFAEQGYENAVECIDWLEKQGTSYTKRCVDDAYVEGMAFAKDELEKQDEQEEPQVCETEDGEVITYSESEGYKVVKPKFHEGEWITNGDYTWKIVEVKPLDYILQAQDGNIVDDTISHVDEQFHSFTIEDAKDGDVLASELCDSIILFKGINDDNNIDFYCDYDFSEIDLPGDRFSVNNGQHYGNVEDSKDFHPATKEQRDALEKAMADAGYIFDFEKKELKKIEQEPTWSEEDGNQVKSNL